MEIGTHSGQYVANSRTIRALKVDSKFNCHYQKPTEDWYEIQARHERKRIIMEQNRRCPERIPSQ